MKAQILKIAGVKSEKEFYKKYPSEEAFMKVHGKAFKKAQTSNAVEKAQFGLLQPAGTTYGTPQQQLSQSAGAAVNTFQQNNPIGTPAAAAGGGGGPLGFLGGLFGGGGGFNPMSAIPIAGSAFGVIDSFINSKKKRDVARQNAALTSVQAQASETRAEDPTRNYNFPQVGLSGGMGMGTNPLARDGAEIQNTYAPGTLYDDLGYEPLSDSDEVKAYAYGGDVPRAQSGFTQFMKNRGSNILSNQLAASNDFNTGSQLGGLLGDVGDFIVPGSSMITKPLLTGVMGALDPIANETKGYKREAQRNQDRIMASQFANSNANVVNNTPNIGYLDFDLRLIGLPSTSTGTDEVSFNSVLLNFTFFTGVSSTIGAEPSLNSPDIGKNCPLLGILID